VLVEYDGAGVMKRRYVHGPGIDEQLSITDAGVSYYLHADRLGTIEAVSDSSGQAVSTIEFESFGTIRSGALASAFGFTGREFDAETQLYYYRARYMDPALGRFISKDPIGLDGGDANFYGYVGNNPVNWVDPWGLFDLPNDPSGLPRNWKIDTQHQYPHGQQFKDPSGRILEWHPKQPGKSTKIWAGRDHWHDRSNFGDEHLPPGTNVPDPAPLPPWWQRIPLRIPLPLPLIIDPCIIDPTATYCSKSCET
jgi:RHS repeat-associated protein